MNKVPVERRGAQRPVAGPDLPERDSGHLHPHTCAVCGGPWLWPGIRGTVWPLLEDGFVSLSTTCWLQIWSAWHWEVSGALNYHR